MKINPSVSFRDYKYIRALTLEALEDEKVGQEDGKGNVNFHNFFGLLNLVNCKMSTNNEGVRGVECDIFREVFWDLFREGIISLGNLESQSMGFDYEINQRDLSGLQFPNFRLTEKFLTRVRKEKEKNKKLRRLKSIPVVVYERIKKAFALLLKNSGILTFLIKGLWAWLTGR